MYDVIVVGGGPSGSSAARRCSQLGLQTLLVDKAIFPREKLCGGAVTEQALSYLGFDLPDDIIEKDIFGARVHFGENVIEVKKPYRIAITVSRTVFDYFLLQQAQAAGTQVLFDRNVSSIERQGNVIKLQAGADTYSGKIIIGCDGFYSVIARYVRRNHKKNEYGNTIEIKIPSDDVIIDKYIYNAVDIHFGVAWGGYGWVFPHKGYFSVGIGGFADQVTNLKDAMRNFLIKTGFSPEQKMRGYSIPAGGFRRKLLADRIILSGDAAGFVDTFQGEGIAYAIRSGQIAGEVASKAISNGNYSTQGLHSYYKICNQEFANDLRYSLYFSRLMHKFPNQFLRIMASDVGFFNKYLEVPARRTCYRKFLMWLIPRIPYFLIKSR